MGDSSKNCFGLTSIGWLLLAMLLNALAVPPVLGRETVLWAALDFPPFQIRQGDHLGSGSFDGLLETLIAQLGEYDHEVATMTFARREEEIRHGQHLCTPGLFRTAAREKMLVFSLPALIHLDNRLVFLANRSERFGKASTANLDSLLKRPDLIGGFISGRSFAPNIDALLGRYAKTPNVVMRPLKSSQIFELLVNGEVDYTILFPHEAAYLAYQSPGQPEIVVRPIDGTPSYIFTHVACTKDAWGEAIISRINRILLEQRRTAAYRAFSERWYVESDQKLIRRYYPLLLAPTGSLP